MPVTVGFKASADLPVLAENEFAILQLFSLSSDKKCQERRMIAASFGHFLVCSNGLSGKPISFKKDFLLDFQTRAATVTGAATKF